ncbi:3-dehydroquinate synthase [Metabacillus fastidiosus]|uniref:3-dehydroquinate synthase n=1 Tax=Metabacillus fastidiosus TaxID=1458 RepID=UPI002DBCC4B0|nr:3-dehydroquinate synthase [Metabacillus fastidiosus]MEC2077467.1 3-dehydroquinate synthase [Metabacillus fastidiosus]
MERVTIQTTSDRYDVLVGKGLINDLITLLETVSPSKVLIVTDSVVDQYFGDEVLQKVSEHFQALKYVVKSGEESKSFEAYYDIQTFALQNEFDRKSALIALGGGVIGDLAGFVAATFMRGIPFIQVPTTLLAHDSAVGGKVAINHPEGKNMIGAFYQPIGVIYDINYLATLPADEFRSGFAEVVKHSFIRNEELYQFLLENVPTLENVSDSILQKMIIEGIKVKAEVVSEDEKELGVREILNFGHTLGHAIEAELGYGKISHGDGVAIGMLFALSLSKQLLNEELPYEQLKHWFKQLGFPTKVPEELSTEQLINRMKRDKKSLSNKIKMILLQSIGVTTSKVFTSDQLESYLNEWRQEE